MGKYCLMYMGFYWGVMKMFWNLIEVVVAEHCDVLNATRLFTLKQCYVNFTSILKKKKLKET